MGQSEIIELEVGGWGSPPTAPTSLTANGVKGFLVPHLLTPPPIVSTLSASEITSTSAVLRASVTTRTWTVGVFFEWGTNAYDNATTVQHFSSSINPILIQAPIRGLHPGFTYSFRAKASYAGSGVVSGGASSFSWQMVPPTVVPAYDYSSNLISLQFTGGIGQIYFVQATTNLVDWTVCGVATDLQTGGFQFDEAALLAGRFYRVLSP